MVPKKVQLSTTLLDREMLTWNDTGLWERHTYPGQPCLSQVLPMTTRNLPTEMKHLDCPTDGGCQRGGCVGECWDLGAYRSNPLTLQWVAETSCCGTEGMISSHSSWNQNQENVRKTGWMDMSNWITWWWNCKRSTSSMGQSKMSHESKSPKMSISAFTRESVRVETTAPWEKRQT